MSSVVELRRVEIHGHELAYRIGGDGPVLLLVHGMAGSSATWRSVLPTLTERFTVIAPDLIGHGQSEKPRGDYSLGAFATGLRDLLLALGHERATLVGQSLGGGVVMQFAYQYPERCERMVLVSSGGLGEDVTLLLRLLALPGAELVLPVACTKLLHGAGLSVASWFRGVGLHTSPHLDEIWSAYGSLTDGATRASFLSTLRSVVDVGGQRVSASDRLYLASEVPTLIIWGDHDRIIPVAQGHETHAAIPGSRLEIFPGAGHFPHCEDPARFCRVLTDFIDTTAPCSTSVEEWRDRIRSVSR